MPPSARPSVSIGRTRSTLRGERAARSGQLNGRTRSASLSASAPTKTQHSRTLPTSLRGLLLSARSSRVAERSQRGPRPRSGQRQPCGHRQPRIRARARRQLCAAAHNCLYVHRPIMCSGGVVIGVSPAMRPRGRCTAEHNRQLREDHRGRQRCEMQARPAGYCQAISQPVFGADALGFHEPVARIAVGGRPSPIDPRWPGYRRIDASPACSASRRLCAAVSAPKDALSRGNEFRSEPVVHNRTLNIEAGVG